MRRVRVDVCAAKQSKTLEAQGGTEKPSPEMPSTATRLGLISNWEFSQGGSYSFKTGC